MFLMSCRAQPLRAELPLLAEYPVSPGLALCLAADPSAVHFRKSSAGFRLEVSPFAPAPATRDTLAVSVDWDLAARELVIRAEPHAGTAVYHHLDPKGGFVCASRVALLRAAGVPIEEEESLLPEYFRYRYVMPPDTLFRGIHHLAKAELRVRASGGRCLREPPRRCAVFPETATAESEPSAIVDRTLAIFQDSLEQFRPEADRLVVPLSGGMDSSVLFRITQRAFGPSDAWSTGYPFEANAQNRERTYAASAAEALGARHRYHAGSTASYLEALIRSIAAAEQPLNHLQSPMFELLFRDAVPPERDVVVLGVGAGGVFGTSLQQLLHRNARHPRLWSALARSPLRPLVAYATRKSGRGRRLARRLALPEQLAHVFPDPQSVLSSVDSYGDPAWIAARFGSTPPDLVRGRSGLLRDYGERDLLELIALIDLSDNTQFVWANILQSVGRRTHFPFMQAGLQQHVFGTPWALRLRSNKFLLAEVARRLDVPEFILGRAKSGFGVQRKDWADRGGPLEPLVAVAAKRVDRSELRSLQSREPGRAQAFWCLLNLGLWRRLCIDGETCDALVAELRAQPYS